MLIFTHLGRIVAILGLLSGMLMLWTGYLDYSREYIDLDPEHKKAILRFANSTLKNGAILLLGSIALGMLAEISFSLRKK